MDGSDSQAGYREYVPSRALAADLVCTWTQTVGAHHEHVQCVYPDTCIDILFMNDHAPIVVGPWTQPFTSRLPAGTQITAARLRPGSALLFGLPADDLLNQSAPLDALWDRRRLAPLERLHDLRDPATRRDALEQALSGSLAQPRRDAQMLESVRWLARHPQARVEHLSRRLGMSGRQLQRRFTAVVGYGPKMFQSVLRFQRLLRLFGTAVQPISLAQAALDAGYSDQAHMTRETQRFAAKSPSALSANASSALELSGLVDSHLPAMR